MPIKVLHSNISMGTSDIPQWSLSISLRKVKNVKTSNEQRESRMEFFDMLFNYRTHEKHRQQCEYSKWHFEKGTVWVRETSVDDLSKSGGGNEYFLWFWSNFWVSLYCACLVYNTPDEILRSRYTASGSDSDV